MTYGNCTWCLRHHTPPLGTRKYLGHDEIWGKCKWGMKFLDKIIGFLPHPLPGIISDYSLIPLFDGRVQIHLHPFHLFLSNLSNPVRSKVMGHFTIMIYCFKVSHKSPSTLELSNSRNRNFDVEK